MIIDDALMQWMTKIHLAVLSDLDDWESMYLADLLETYCYPHMDWKSF